MTQKQYDTICSAVSLIALYAVLQFAAWLFLEVL